MTGIENEKTLKLLNAVDDEIEKKCFELKEARKAKNLKRLFYLGSLLAVAVPVSSAIFGYFILTALIPVFLFQAVSLILLLPMILSSSGGVSYVE